MRLFSLLVRLFFVVVGGGGGAAAAVAAFAKWKFLCRYMELEISTSNLGPVVQSVVSLTNSLRVISFTILADSIYNILIFFAEKMWVAFALQKLLIFFQQKISAYLHITRCKF